MVVFFTASYYGKEKYQRYYDMVLRTIEQRDIQVIGTEKGNYLTVLPKKEKEKIGDPKTIHYEAIRKGILESDAVIIEMSYEDFQLGHEATLAIMSKKHVLCLSLHEDFSKKIRNEYFHGAKYNEVTLASIIRDFFNDICKKRYSERFNCFLSKEQLAYLEDVSRKEDMNKSEYVRKLIESDIKVHH